MDAPGEGGADDEPRRPRGRHCFARLRGLAQAGDLLGAVADQMERPLRGFGGRPLRHVIALAGLKLAFADGFDGDECLGPLVAAGRHAQRGRLAEVLLARSSQLDALQHQHRLAAGNHLAQVDRDRGHAPAHVRGDLQEAVLVVLDGAVEDEQVLEVDRLQDPGLYARLRDGGAAQGHRLRQLLVMFAAGRAFGRGAVPKLLGRDLPDRTRRRRRTPSVPANGDSISSS
jgi:hypothetical protein